MFYDTRNNFAFLANTKCASSTIERSIPEKKHILKFQTVPYKHINYRKFSKFVEMFNVNPGDITTCAVVRDPFERAGSWYRYRKRPMRNKAKEKSVSTKDMTFDDFLEFIIEKRRLVPQLPFVIDEHNVFGVDYIFDYRRLDRVFSFIEDNLRLEINYETKNVSPSEELVASPGIRSRFDNVFSDEIEFYRSVQAVGCLESGKSRA